MPQQSSWKQQNFGNRINQRLHSLQQQVDCDTHQSPAITLAECDFEASADGEGAGADGVCAVLEAGGFTSFPVCAALPQASAVIKAIWLNGPNILDPP